MSHSGYHNHQSNKHIIYFHILHILTIVIFTLRWYESVKHYKGIKQSAEKWGVSKFMRGKKGHYMLVEKETCVCVCESCNYEDEDTAAVLTHYCFQWITMKNTVTLSVECHISGKNTTAFCLITILIFCQQWKEVMLDAGFVGYKCVQIMVLHPSFGKQPKIMRINTRRILHIFFILSTDIHRLSTSYYFRNLSYIKSYVLLCLSTHFYWWLKKTPVS